LLVPAGVSAVSVPGCARAQHAGGEWRSYGGPTNSRDQVGEKTITAAKLVNLKPKWIFDASTAASNGGVFSNTPVVADGCVFLATDQGWVFAVNADTGRVVWRQFFPGQSQLLLGGVIVGSPVVANGIVYVGVSNPEGTKEVPQGPYVAAMDEFTGQTLWVTIVERGQKDSFINSSPVYFNGMIFQGVGGNEGGDVSNGAYAILDASRACSKLSATVCPHPVAHATGGTLLKHVHIIPEAEYKKGYRGGSIWCTPAVDARTRYAYACTGNPASKRLESRYTNALLKIDLDRTRKTFGKIVGLFKGETDHYVAGLDKQPVCQMFGEQLVYLAWSAGCVQFDLDFGASPNLFTDSSGHLLVGDLQKSGIYHVVRADTMKEAWKSVVGIPCFSCNAASGAFDRSGVYVAAAAPGQLISLSKSGQYRWASPIGDGTHYQSVTAANGLVYAMDNYGTMNVFDAASGLLQMRRPLAMDVGQPFADASSTGIAIARNTIYAASNQWVVAFR
jgi:outer membrane protein assembly factor BamB